VPARTSTGLWGSAQALPNSSKPIVAFTSASAALLRTVFASRRGGANPL